VRRLCKFTEEVTGAGCQHLLLVVVGSGSYVYHQFNLGFIMTREAASHDQQAEF